MSLEYYRWFFHRSPHGPGLCITARHGAETIAHQAIARHDLMMTGGDRIPAGQSSCLVVAPAYRGRGVFPRISAECFSFAEESGLDVVFFFQAGDVRSLPWYRRMGCIDLGVMPVVKRPLLPSRVAARKWGRWAGMAAKAGDFAWTLAHPLPGSDVILSPIDEFTQDFIFPTLGPEKGISTVRDPHYLNFRFREDPLRRYEILGATRGERKCGYVVFAVDRSHPDKWNLIDLSVAAGSEEAVLSSALREARRRGASAIYSWDSTNALMRRTFSGLEFRRVAGVHGRLLVWISRRRQDLRALSLEEWLLTMGDSDLY